jgi:hypothetical protein
MSRNSKNQRNALLDNIIEQMKLRWRTTVFDLRPAQMRFLPRIRHRFWDLAASEFHPQGLRVGLALGISGTPDAMTRNAWIVLNMVACNVIS